MRFKSCKRHSGRGLIIQGINACLDLFRIDVQDTVHLLQRGSAGWFSDHGLEMSCIRIFARNKQVHRGSPRRVFFHNESTHNRQVAFLRRPL